RAGVPGRPAPPGRELPPLEPGQEWFTKSEAAAALRVGPAAFQAMIRRHRLTAVGNGKARRFPRSAVEFLRARPARRRSTQPANYSPREATPLCHWMVKARRMGDTPLAHLAGGNARLDRRHDRRALSADELRRVIQAARDSARPFRGLTGVDRAAI